MGAMRRRLVCSMEEVYREVVAVEVVVRRYVTRKRMAGAMGLHRAVCWDLLGLMQM